MNVALIHDHLTQLGGAERVLRIFTELYPKAPIFTLVYDKKRLGEYFPHAQIIPSYLQNIPFAKKKYQWLLPLMPNATESYDLSRYDLVLSSTSAFAKGIITKSTTLHICYCHTPTRYLWTDTHSYLKELHQPRALKRAVPFLLSGLRIWDRSAADRVDKFIANSRTVQERIKKYYRRESDIIYPPVELDKFSMSNRAGEHYLAGGRLVSYKRFDLIVQAFNRLGLPLNIFGEGPEYKKLRSYAKKNIIFTGAVSDPVRAELYKNCIAYLHPQEEDFGITAIEAMASGKPVIALAAGGALETIVDKVTGVFFFDQDYAALIDAVIRFKPDQFSPQIIRNYALKFSADRFKKEILQYVNRSWQDWQELQHMRRLRETKMMF
ncbi:glycosyltransferase [Candidatus Uhrbacteria bacterium]|nr:glycosyltransferase [Candidatus Uhrbacteria bacterium]